MSFAWTFLAGYILDLLLGDPSGWPHPIRFMGRLCTFWENRLYRNRIEAGIVFWTAFTVSLGGLLGGVLWICSLGPSWLETVVVIYLIYACLATRSLHKETKIVEDALSSGNLDEARKRLSYVVGRETAQLGPEEIRRALIETVAENVSDGVIAPLFYGIVFGLPGMIFYKGVNTLDSMVGYKNERYLYFGRMAAKADDVANYLPARITALLIVVSSFLLRLDGKQAFRVMRTDHSKASSPNAGWPEAAMAGALGVRLGGPSAYFGKVVDKPVIGGGGRLPEGRDYHRAARVLYAVSLLTAAVGFFILSVFDAGIFGLIGTVFPAV